MKTGITWWFYCVLITFCFLTKTVNVVAEIEHSADNKNSFTDKGNEQNHDTTGQMMLKKCLRSFSASCLKLAFVKILDRLPAQYRVYPGISLVRNTTKPTDVEGSNLLKLGTSQAINLYTLQKMKSFLYSFNVKVELENPELLKRVKNLTEDVVDALVPQSPTDSGRSKKGGGGGGGGHHAMMWSACTLAAVGFSIMAAVAGKALMASVLALMLALLSAFKGHGHGGGGGGHKTAHVEIIAKPHHVAHYQATGPSYLDHDHYHSSYTAPAYEYARTMPVAERTRLGPAMGTVSITDGEAEESHQLAYRAQYKDTATTYRPIHLGQT